MAFAAGKTNQFKKDILNGVHQPGDVYKIALYTQAAAPTLNKSLTAYTATGELANGNGYTRDSKALINRLVAFAGDIAYLDFDDPVWNPASLTADAALIYNSSRSNRAIAVLSFPTTISTNGAFTVKIPAPGPEALITVS